MEGLEVVSGDGDVVVEGVLAGEDGIALSTVRGRIRVKDVIANTMGLHSITGDIVGEGLGASSKLLVTSTSGVIKLDDIMTKYTSAFAESGSMAINRLTSSESIRISSVSAPITLHSLRGRFKSLVASSDTGNVRITSAQLRPDGAVEVSAHSRTGKCIVELVGFTGVFDVNTGSATAGVVVHGGAEAKWWVRDGRRRFGHYRFRYEGMHKLTAVSEAGPVRVILENGLRVKALT
ncbi:hypothetical protein HK101_004759 [Irineochytrium annulatum]|nr:hypothetical protein HK101_004759 [Irineochytrium annulatum]